MYVPRWQFTILNFVNHQGQIMRGFLMIRINKEINLNCYINFKMFFLS